MKAIKSLLVSIVLFLPVLMYAESMVIGKGDYQYSDGIFKSSPDEEERGHALNKAKSNAVLAYADTLPEATRKLFEEKRAQFLSNPDRYIIRYNVAKEKMDKASRMYSVIIEAIVDDAKVKNDIGDSYGDKNSAMAKNNIAVFFIARKLRQQHLSIQKSPKCRKLKAKNPVPLLLNHLTAPFRHPNHRRK